MEVKSFTNKNNHTIYFVVEDDGTVIKPIYDYMLFLVRNNYSINSVRTICFHLKLYFEWLTLTGLTYKTAVNKKSDTNKGILINLSDFKTWLKYPSYNDGIIYLQEVKAARTAATVNQIMSAVFGFYNFLTANEEIDEFPVYTQMRSNPQFRGMLSEMLIKKENTPHSMLKEKEPKRLIKYITKADYEKLLHSALNLRDKVIIGLMFDGGLRVSEVIGLHIEDLREIAKNKVRIVKRDDPKNPDAAVKYNSVGSVFVSDEIRDLIIRYMTEYLSYIDTDYFVFNNYGETKLQPMRRKTIEKMLKKAGKRCGVLDVTPHMLRHGCAVYMLKQGASMREIQDKLRHKSPETTARVYAEFDDEGRKEAMKKIYEKGNVKFTPDSVSMDELAQWLMEDDEDE